MARYGIDVYGAAYYGADGLINYDVDPFTVRAMLPGQLMLNWTFPTGSFDTLRLVRNSYGNPVTEEDGTTVLQTPSSTSVVSYTDTGLTQGSFYYYSIFVREVIGAGYKWHRAGDASGLVVTDYAYTDLLLDRLPTIFTTTPPSTATSPDGDDLLARFLGLFGFQLDSARTTLESLRDTKDADRVSGTLLPLLAAELGQINEPEIGQRQMRVLLRNSVYLYKKKGTTAGATALASALTGWGTNIIPFTNIMPDVDHASAEQSIGTWAVISGPGVLTRRASDILLNPNVIPPGAIVGYRNPTNSNPSAGMFQLTGTGAGAVTITHAQAGAFPIDPSKGPVTASIWFRDTGTSRVPTVGFAFFDRLGNQIAGGAQTQSAGATSTGDWLRRQTSTTTPPAGTRYGALIVTYPVIANAEVQLFDAVQVEYGSTATNYQAPRLMRLQLLPNRTNLITNPSAEVDTASWTPGASTTVTRSSLQAMPGGTYSFRLVPTGGVSGSMSTTYASVSETTYMTSHYVYGPAGTYTLTVGSTGAVSGAVTAAANTWTRVNVLRTTATGETTTPVTVNGPAGATFFADDVLAERGAALLPYFDGVQIGSLDQGWTGSPHASTSVQYTQRAVRDYRLRANLPRYLPFGQPFSLEYVDNYVSQ